MNDTTGICVLLFFSAIFLLCHWKSRQISFYMGEQFPCEAAVIRNHALTRSRPNWGFTVYIHHGKVAASGSMTPGGTVH